MSVSANEHTVVIHHNAECGTSRNVLAMIQSLAVHPVVVDYLKVGWTKPQLQALFAAAGLTPTEALRVSKSPAKELGLTDPGTSDEAILNAMVQHPVLVNRPIVCTAKGVALCRPSEAIFEMLDFPDDYKYTKEDGEVVMKNPENPQQ